MRWNFLRSQSIDQLEADEVTLALALTLALTLALASIDQLEADEVDPEKLTLI